VLERLPACPQVHPVADLGVSCYCAYSGTQEMWHKPGNRVAGNDGIRIDANENFFVTQMLESKIQRIGFAGIGLSQNKNLAPDFFACKRGADRSEEHTSELQSRG